MLLNKLREGAKGGVMKFVIYGFIAFAVGGMVFMDVGGFFRGGVQRNSVAKIGKEQVSAVSFESAVRRALYAQNIDTATAYKLGLIDRILASLISGNLMHKAAYDLGLQIGDKDATAHIGRLLEPMVTEGLTKKEVLGRLLLSQGMSEQQFLSDIRRDMATAILRNALQTAASYIPPQEARQLYLYQNETRAVDALILPNSAVKDYKEPGDEILLPFYQAGQERYAIPETRNFSMMILKGEDLKKTLDISDEELQKLYEDNISAYQNPERRMMEQAIFQDEDSAAKAFATLASGSVLRDAVTKTTGKTDAYLGEQTFERDGLAKEIADAAFTAAKGSAVGPIKTALGWHVLTVKDILPPHTQPFSDVREQIKAEALHDKLADQLYNLSAQADDMLAAGDALEDIAKKMDASLKSYGPLREDGSTPDSKEGLKGFDKDRADIMKTVYELIEGESAPVMQLDDGSYAVIRVDSVTPKSYKPFDEVKGELKKIWVADQQSVLNRQRASDALRGLADGSKTLQQVAAEYGANVKRIEFKRSDEPPAPLTSSAAFKLFETARGEYAMVTAKDGYIVGQVASITLPEEKKISQKEIDKTVESVAQEMQEEFLMAYLQNLYESANVKINHALLEQMYGPGSEGQ